MALRFGAIIKTSSTVGAIAIKPQLTNVIFLNKVTEIAVSIQDAKVERTRE
jgi:hypothetical protein